jgi:catechol 2,3-dioxygenase-like lactoylglutathione lyase family enzyme
MERQGVEFTAGILGMPGGRVWTYFKDPDGYLYEIAEPWVWRRAEGAVPPGSDPPAERVALTVKGFPWVGIRPKRDFQASLELFGNIMGLKLHQLHANEDFAHFILPSGESLELFGPKHPHAQVTGGPVLGFSVDDLDAARTAMEARGVQFLSETTHADNGSRAWAHFRDPSGFVHEICQGWS